MASYAIHSPEHYRPPDPTEKLIISIEDPWTVWPLLKDSLETRLPLKKATLNNKARNPVVVDKLPLDYITTNDSRLRSRPPGERTPFWFRNPYCHLILVACEDSDEYKSTVRTRLKSMLLHEYREWLIVYVVKTAITEVAAKASRRVFARLEDDFNTKKRERCCKLEVYSGDSTQWEDLCNKVVECIRNTLEQRVQFYEDEVRRITENRFLPGWNFCNFLVIKESLAFMFEMAQLREDALREYDELEQCYLEVAAANAAKGRAPADFGGGEMGDERAALLEVERKKYSQFIGADSVREFDFRQYIFARQAALLFLLQRPGEVADRGIDFILSFAQSLRGRERQLPFGLREVWVFTAALALATATAEKHGVRGGPANAAHEREFARLQADLYALARTKLMRLGDLVGFGRLLEHTPCNSAALSMAPWPRPAVWPPLLGEAAARAVQKEQEALADSAAEAARREAAVGVVGAAPKQLPLAPGPLAPEANRRRASLAEGAARDTQAGSSAAQLAPRGPPADHAATSASAANGTVEKDAVSPSAEAVASGSPQAAASASKTPPRSPGSSGWPGSGGAALGYGRSVTMASGGSRLGPVLKLWEVQAAAEAALLRGLSDEGLKKALGSIDGFEELYLSLTRQAADNYHRSSRRRHGVILDGEVAAIHLRRGNLDSAVKLYEKLCARYAAERWHHLLAQVLPRLLECQRLLGDLAGQLSSCMRLLAVEPGICTEAYRRQLQAEVVRAGQSGLQEPLSMDVSALLTFAATPGLPLELCEGDPGTLHIVAWSGFPDVITLEALSVTLQATGGGSSEEAAKVMKAAEAPTLAPGKTALVMAVPPLRAGSYVLGTLTAVLGRLRLRSHTCCTTSAASRKGGPPEADDYLTSERPLRPAVQVAAPRPLVDITPAVASGLLVGEVQWVGLVIRPLAYSLQGALLHVTASAGLTLEEHQSVEVERWPQRAGEQDQAGCSPAPVPKEASLRAEGETLQLKGGTLALPAWAAEVPCVVWLKVHALRDHSADDSALITAYTPNPTPSPSPPPTPPERGPSFASSAKRPPSPPSAERKLSSSGGALAEVAGVLSVRLEYGLGRSREHVQALALSFVEPLHAEERVASKGSDGTLLLQVTLRSQVAAALRVQQVELALQPRFQATAAHPAPPLLPLTVQSGAEGALLFTLTYTPEEDSLSKQRPPPLTLPQPKSQSTLVVQYRVAGDRRLGAHDPPALPTESPLGSSFRHSFVLQLPVTERRLAVGLLPPPPEPPRVGRPVVLSWRLERLVEGATEGDPAEETAAGGEEELKYEVKLSTEQWMVAGRRKGRLRLSVSKGAVLTLAMACTPTVAGHIRPPALQLPQVNRGVIAHSPAGPHMICVLPADTCSSFCTTKRVAAA